MHGLARDFALLVPLTVCPHSRLNVYVLMLIASLIVKYSITAKIIMSSKNYSYRKLFFIPKRDLYNGALDCPIIRHSVDKSIRVYLLAPYFSVGFGQFYERGKVSNLL